MMSLYQDDDRNLGSRFPTGGCLFERYPINESLGRQRIQGVVLIKTSYYSDI